MELIVISKEQLRECILEALQEKALETNQQSKEEILLDKKEVSNLLNVSESTIDNYRRQELLPSYRIGNKIWFKKDEVIEAATKQIASL